MIKKITILILITGLLFSPVFAEKKATKKISLDESKKNNSCKCDVKKTVDKPRCIRTKVPIKKVIIPGIELRILGIIGNDSKRIAHIEFEGRTDDYFKGDIKVGAFKVVSIGENYVTVYSLRKKRQRTFRL